MSSSISGGGFNYELQSVGGLWTWKVTSNNIVNSGQYFYVADINSPFGPLDVINSPIPGDVVIAMADSVNTFQQQLAANLYLTSSSSVSLTVSEGDYITDAGLVTFMNTGALGSFLSVSSTSTASWLKVAPSSILGIGKNQVGSTKVQVDPTNLSSSSSPYSALVNVQNLASPFTITPVAFNINVLPRPEITLSSYVVNFSYNIATNSLSGPVTLDITNSGPLTSLLSYYLNKVQNHSPWLSFTPASGGPLDSGDSSSVVFTANVSGITKITGSYTETVVVSSVNATNSPAVITVTMTVT